MDVAVADTVARMPGLPTAIILAAGLSRRAAPRHKLLLPAPDGSGRTVVRATVEAFCGAAPHLAEIVVVTGHARAEIEAALAGLPVRGVFASDFAQGMGHSLAAGVRATNPDTPGFLVSPGDLPGLGPALVARVAAAANAGEPPFRRHIVPTADGRRGHPVFLGSWLREALSKLTGDMGARLLLQLPRERSRTDLLEVRDEAILRDVDA
ncbi:MAG: nucleotidyltransferase family protein [Opitutaceae bacterium]|nr:nucleotidyltransferase family protein [Opitutaceae bacterium]